MPKEQSLNLPPRNQAVALVAQKFVREYYATIQHYKLAQQLELTEHLLDVLELIRQYTASPNENLWKQYTDKEEALLKKYGKTLKPYVDTGFYKYFDFTLVLAEKGIYPDNSFNHLAPEEQGLTVNEILLFIRLCLNTLYNAKTFLSLQLEPETALIEPTTAPAGQDEPEREITKARQLLFIYYLLKTGFNIEHRIDAPSSAIIARLAHLMTGTKFTNLQNSDIYKMYSEMPYYKIGEPLISDLRFIRPYFEKLKIQGAVKLVDEEIQRAINELPSIDRKKYRQ